MKYLYGLLIVFMALPVIADDNIVIVFDTSNSMGTKMSKGKGTRMEVAKEALNSVLQEVPETTKIGLLTFGGWAFDLQTVDKEALKKAIFGMGFTGGTPLYRYTKAGADRLLQERAKNGNVGSYKLLVVTDGAADQDDAPLLNDGSFANGTLRLGVLKDIISRGITVDAIGLELSNGHALEKLINGTYMKGDDAESIKKSLQKSVAEVGFDGKDNLSSFDVVSELPEDFVQSCLKGLTEFKNHPIGQQPPPVVINTTGVQNPPVTMPVVNNSIESGNWTRIWILFICSAIVVGVITTMSFGRSY